MIRDEPIVDLPPIVPRLDAVIVLHPAFLADALPRLVAAPLIVTDAWAWPDADATGRVVPVPAREIAADLGVPVAAGLALVGAFAELTGRRDADSLASAVRSSCRPPHGRAARQPRRAGRGRRVRHQGSPAGRPPDAPTRDTTHPGHGGDGARPLQGMRAVRAGVPARGAGDDRERNAKGYVLPRLLDGCTGCRACAEVCPDFVFEVYRFDRAVGVADHDARAARGLRRDGRRRGRRRLPVLRRLPDAPLHRAARHVRKALPPVDGVFIQADTEIEGANMALGAAATGARAATGSTGQGIALMQETIAEAALNELPLVVFNVARGQQDYFQAPAAAGGATTARSRWPRRAWSRRRS